MAPEIFRIDVRLELAQCWLSHSTKNATICLACDMVRVAIPAHSKAMLSAHAFVSAWLRASIHRARGMLFLWNANAREVTVSVRANNATASAQARRFWIFSMCSHALDCIGYRSRFQVKINRRPRQPVPTPAADAAVLRRVILMRADRRALAVVGALGRDAAAGADDGHSSSMSLRLKCR